MAKKLGTIKSISGSTEVIAVDKSGNQRVLKVGDSLYEGESVKTTSADSKVVIATNNGKELSMIGEDTLTLDPKATAGDAQVAALQKALLNGANLGDLEETAAGGTSGGRAGDGVSLGSASFEQGGHYSNISASTSAINSLGGFGFASPETGVRGGLDNGGTGGGTGFYIDTTAPVVTINSINPVDENNPADGNPDKGIVKGHSDEPNAPVVVKDKDGKIIGTGTTDDKGNFEVTTDPIKPGDKVTVEVTDKAGNTGKGDGTAGNTVYTDTTPPTVEDVKVTPVDENNPADGNPDKGIVKGHSDEPNAPVVVKDKDGKIIGTGTTDDKGNFEVTTDPIKPGDKVTVEVTDKAGNTGKGDGTAGNTVYTDTTPPTVEDVKVTPVDENNPADGNPDKGIVKGHSDEPNAPVVVKDKDGKIIGTGTTDDKGNFEVTTDPIKPGDKVTVEVTDKAGNTGKGDGTAGNTVYTDTTPPTVDVETATPVDQNNPADGNPDKGIVKGKSDEPNALVVITDKDGNEIGRGTTDGNGGFTIETKPFNPGDPITATVTDKAGNKGSDTENAGNLTHPNDHTATSDPTITFVEDINPKDGKLNKAENGSDSDNANTTAKISIPTDAVVNDVIKYTVNGEEKSHPITEADKAKGHIEVKVPVVDGQTSTITAKIVDQAGNASKEVSGSVDVDLTIGNPKVRFLEDADNNGVLSVAEVAAIKDGKAHWVIDIPTDGSVKAGDVIQSIDSKGNWVKFVTITDEMIKDGRFEATFNVDIEKLRNGKYETPEYRFADDAGNISDSSKATLTLDSELTRQPSNPSIKFPEDNDPKDGKISDKENKAGDGDAGKTTAEIVIPQDGSVKPGDKLIVTDDKGKETVRPIEQSDIDKGSIDVPVDLNPGKDNTIIAEIVNPNNPDNPGKGKGVIGENSEATKAPEAPVIVDVIDDVEGGKFNQSVKGGLTNDNTPTIKGTAKAGSTVIIYDNDVEIGRIEKADANWEFTTPVLTKQGEHKFTAIAKNEFGESGSSNEATIELDTIAPVIKEVTITPIDTAAKADDTAEATLIVGVTDTPHATVIAKDKDGNFLGRADANDKGGFVIDAKPVNPGDKVVFEVTDKAGNTSESEFKAGDLAHPNDHTAPKVDIETVTPVDETKPSDGTPDKGIVKGKSDEPNAPVVVKDKDGKIIGTGTTDDKGNFEVTTDPIKPGDKVTVEVTDKAGNKGKDTETAGDTDIIHKDLPEVPVINEVIDNVKGYGEDTKVGNVLDVEGHLTNDKTPTIKGTAKAGSTVVIYDNGVEIGKIEKADANWEFTTPVLTKQGEHKFTATAENKFGKSAPSNEATIDLDSIAPKLDNVKITPIDTNSRADDTAEITMGTGHTDTPNAEILFRDGDNNIIGKGHANNLGDFAIQLDKAVQPGTPVFVQAIDKAGNAGTDMAVAGNIEHPNDHTATSDPTITFVEDINPKDGKLNKAENGSDSDNANTTAKISIPTDAVVNDVIKYTVNGEEKSHPITEADKAKGHIEVKVPVVDGQTSTITAKIVDQAGNASKEVSGSVDVDLTIGNPKVRFLEDADNNGVLSVAEVAAIKDGKAHWVIDIPTDGSVKAGDVIQSIDSKGNWVKFVTITDEMIKDGRFEATFNVDIEKLRNGKYETPEYRFADDAGNISDSSKATLTLDSELTRQPSNPSIKFPEDNDPKDGKISDKENKAGDGDAGKTTAEIVIPQDGSVKPGDKLIVKDNSDKPKEHVITEKDIENGKVEVTVDIKTGDKTTITAEIVNPNNPSKPSEEISKDITEASSTVQVTIDEIYDDVAGGVVNGDVKNGLTNDNLPTFKGSAAPGATVEIYESFLTTTEKTLVGKIVADANGKWSFTPTEAMGDGLHYFEAHATDSAGNKSITPKVELDVDATAPSVENLKVSPLDISNPADNTPEKGRVEGSSDTQDAKVIVKDEAGNVIGEGKVGGDGKFVIDTTKPLNPGDKVKVEITDEAGNTGKGSAVTGNDIIHTHATTQVTIDEIYDDVAGGVVNGDVKNGLTNDNLPTFKGSAAPGATVEIYESFLTTTEKTLVGKIVADANGKWSFTPTEAMGDGLHYFEAHATDSAGNKSITPKVELDVDATAPSVENLKVSPLDISNPADNTPEKGRVEGSSDTQDAKVIVKDEAGNVIGEGKVGGDGKFVIDTTKPLNPGDKVKVEITDEAGNTGKGSAVTGNDIIHTHATTQVTIDEIYDDVAGGVVNGDVKNGLTNDNLPTFKGSAAPGATVEIYESFLTTTEKTLVGKIVADANGKWSFTPTEAMGDGLHYFEAHATDSAGNKSITPKVELDVDATAPSVENLKVSPLDISNPADNTPEKGRVEGSSDTQDAKVIVKDEAGNVIGEGKVGGDGKFVIDTTKPLNPGDKVKVEITDEAGNTGKGSAVTGNDIIHTHATTQVTIDEIYDDVAGGVVNGDVKNGLTNDNLPTFKGSAAPGATVEIYESFLTTTEKTLVGKIVADANGKWSFTPTEAMGDGLHYFEAHATDSAGNKSITPKVELDVDATANAPVINAVNDDVDSHTGNVLDAKTKVALTNDSTPTLEGYAEPNSVVTIYEISELSGDKRAIGTTTADKHGGWKFELPQLEDGEYQYTTRIQDKAGNISDFSETVVVNVDLVAPSEPTIIFIEDINKKDGMLNKAENGKDGDNASTTAQISVPGDAEENDVIHYTVNGEEKTHTITYNDRVAGYIEVKVPVVDGKTSTVTAKIVDQAGNSSEIVKESISSDFTAPNVQITGIIDNVPGGTYKDNVAGTSTNDNKPTIKGKADANQEVVIYDTDKEIGRTTADKDGNWEFKPIDYKEPLADLVGRVHIIKAVVTDAAGNSSEATSALEVDTTVGTPKVKFKEDLNNNEVLSVEEVKALTDGKLHWIVEIPTDGISVKAGDTLQVYGKNAKWQNAAIITNDDITKGFVERDGFVMDLPKGNGAQSPAYRIVDKVGNESEGNFANLVYDSELTRQPSNPSVKFPEDNDPKDGKISDKENKAGDNDAGKTTAEISIPKDGSVKPGDKLIVTDDKGKETVRPIEQSDIDKGSIDVPVDLNPGKDNTIIAEIVNPNNPDNPGKGKGVIGENSEATKAPEAPVIVDVIDDVEGGKFNQSVKGGLTNDNTPTIKGTAKAGSTVIIYDNDVEIGRIEKADANWEFTTPVLTKQGEHKFTAIAKNEFGKSTPSNEVTIDLDTKAPTVENVKVTPIDMSNPADSTPEKGRVEGRSDTPGAIVVIKDQAGNEIGRDNVKADKSFTIETTKPINKGDKVTVEITDEAGNTGKGKGEAGNLKHEGDNVAPCDPTITFVEDINPKDSKLNKAENGSDSDNANTTAKISFLPDVVKGDVIKYTINNGNEQNHTVTADDVKAGYIEIKVPVVDGKTSTVTAKIVDQAGNSSEMVKESISSDFTAPNTPVITAVIDEWYGGVEFDDVLGKDKGLTNDNTPKFKGTAEAGSTIVLKNGNEIIGKDIEVKADGTWEFTPKTPLADGEYNITATATDKAGNVSNPSNVATINVDTNCPKPVIAEIIDDVAGGAVNGDVKFGLTNDNLPTLKGIAEPFAKVKFMIDGRPVFKDGKEVFTTADENGKWEYTLEANSNWGGKVHAALEDGRHTFEAQATDKAGNNSQPSDVVGVDVDTTVNAPKVRITADADDNNILTATEASTLTDGKLKWVIELPKDAKEGDRLEVSNNHRDWVSVVTLTAADIKAGTITRDDFSADLVKGKLGFQTPSYRIVDQAGNISAEDTDAVKFEKSASRAPIITEVFDDQSGSALIDAKNKTIGNVLGKNNGLTNDNTPTFKGTAEVGTTITLKNGNVVIGKDIPVNADGTWEFTPSAKLADGRYNIVATSTNIFGTESTPSNIAAVTVDTDPGAVLIKEVIDDVKGGKFNQSVLGIDKGLTNDNTPLLKGTAEPESIVEIKVDGKVVGTTTTTTEGTWSYQVTTPIKDGSRKISVVSHDKAGNISSEVAETINVDTITPAPTIDRIIDNKEGGKFKEDVKGGITNDNRPVIEGTAEAHATVELFDNGKSMGTTKAGEDGKWTLRPEKPMADGNHVITAKATDLAGNENWSKVSASSDISTDAGVVKITAVCDNVAGWNNQTGNVLGINGGLTNDNTPTIKGTAKPGMAVTIKNGDQVIEGNVEYAKDGSWEFTPKTPLADGLYNITAVATSNTGAQSVSNVAAINVDARIADAKVEFIEDANNDGKFSWKENIENPNIGRMAWKAIIPQDGSIKEGDIFHYRWGSQDSWHSREVKQSDIDRGFIGEKVQNQYEQGQPNAGKPLAFGANANGRVYEAEAYFTDAAGNIGKSDSDKVVFDFSDRPAKHIKINAEAIYESNKLGLFMEKHGPVLKASTEVQPYINSDDHYELDVKTITHGAHLKFGAGDDVINIHTRGGWGWINEGSVLNLGHGHNNLTVATNVDVSTVIAGNGNDTVVIDGWLTNNSTVKLGDGDNKLTVGTNIDKSTVLAGSGNDEVVVGQWQHAGDSWVTNRSTLHLGDGDNKITVGTNIDSSSIETGKGNDVIKVGGYIHNSKVDLGAGDDTLVVGKADLANSKVDGGTGYDKLVLDNPGKSVNLSSISKFASNFEELDISGANNTKLNVNIKDVLEMTDDKNTLKITGDKGDTVDLKENIGAGGWSKGASEDGYTTYTNNTVTIQIKDEIHVI